MTPFRWAAVSTQNNILHIYVQYSFSVGHPIINQGFHWVVNWMVDYSPLWETMKQKGISQYALIQAGIDRRTLDWLKKNKNITMLSLEKLCTILDCGPGDVVRFIK